MKKVSILIVILIATYSIALSQPRAIGGRVSYGIGASYQHGLGTKNMLQADLDFVGFWGVQGTVTYNWIIPIQSWSIGELNAFAGVGGGAGYLWWSNLGYWREREGYYRARNHCTFVGVAGNGGVEFNFKFRLQLSVDWRPIIGPAFYRRNADMYWEGLYVGAFAIGVRYKLK